MPNPGAKDRMSVVQLAARRGWGYLRTRDAVLKGLGGLQLVMDGHRMFVTVASAERWLANERVTKRKANAQ